MSRLTILGLAIATLLVLSLVAAEYIFPKGGSTSQEPNPLPSFGVSKATVTVGPGPYGVACALEGGECYVAVSGEDEVAVVDNQSKVVGDIHLGGAVDFLAFDPSNSLLYASLAGNSSVAVVNASIGAVVSTVAVGAGASWLAFDPASGTIYCVDTGTSSVSVISGESLVATIALSGGPLATAYDLFDGNVYVTNQQGTVFVIDGATNSLIRTIDVANPTSVLPGIAYSASNRQMYVTDSTDDAVIALNATKVTGTLEGFDSPAGIAFSLTSSEMFVVNSGNGTVTASWNGKFSTLSVGSDPREVAFDPSTGDILVTNYGGTTLSVVGA